MTRHRMPAAFLTTLAVLALAFGSARDGRGQGSDTQPRELLAQLPHDNLTLIDNTQYQIEPISPRPLPPLDASRTRKSESTPVKGDTLTQRAQEAAKKSDDNPDELIIHLLEGDIRDFRVKRASIKDVKYWEDLLLEEGERLVLARNFAKAFEYYLAVEARNPNWRGLQEHVDKLLFEEGTWALAGQQRERGLRLLHELHRRRPDYPDLAPKLADAFGGEINDALRQGTYAYGRKVLHDLRKITPDSALLAELKTRFQTRARDFAAKSARRRVRDREARPAHPVPPRLARPGGHARAVRRGVPQAPNPRRRRDRRPPARRPLDQLPGRRAGLAASVQAHPRR